MTNCWTSTRAEPYLEDRTQYALAVGCLLTEQGCHDLWQLAYLKFNEGNMYTAGDETLFLLGKPTSAENGYQGPPATSAPSAAACARERCGRA